MAVWAWRKAHRNRYELFRDGSLAAAVNAHRPPNNSHFAIWAVEISGREVKGGQPTLRDAKIRAALLVGNEAKP